MTLTPESAQPQPRKNNWDKRWILAIIVLLLLLLTARRVIPAYSSNAPIPGNVLVTPSLTPTAAATATATAPAASTSIPTPRRTATAIATSTSEPTATQTMTSFSIPGATVNVTSDFVNLRAGPGTNFAIVQKLTLGEPLALLGRLSDNTWLYVKTSGGQEGWILTISVNLVGIDMDYHPIETPPAPPEITVKVSGALVNLRTGPSTKFSKVQKLTFGEPLRLMGRLSDKTWLYVKISDGREGWIETAWVDLTGVNLDYDYFPVEISPPTETSTPVVLVGIEGRWISIDLSEQKLYAYEGTDQVASFLVSTGLDRYPTERGQYHIFLKKRFTDMRGDDYFLPNVPYSMFYSGDFSIHGTYWHHSFGTPMSHGCVNMDISDAEWLYNWASVGTLVHIHR